MSVGVIILLYVAITAISFLIGYVVGKELSDKKHHEELKAQLEYLTKKNKELQARHDVQVAKVNELEHRLAKKENANG